MRDVDDSFVLWGGPRDGQVLVTSGRPPLAWHIPIPLDWREIWAGDTREDYLYEPMKIGVYAPDCDPQGFVHRNDLGQLVYRWKGIR